MKGGKGIIVATLVFAIVGACRIAGAQEGDVPIVRLPEPLAIVSTGPTDGAEEVPPGSKILIQFSQPIDCMTISGASLWLAKANAAHLRIPASLRCDGRSIILTPEAPLSIDASYAVTVSSLIRSAKGEKLDKDVSFSFSTSREALTVLPTPAAEGSDASPFL